MTSRPALGRCPLRLLAEVRTAAVDFKTWRRAGAVEAGIDSGGSHRKRSGGGPDGNRGRIHFIAPLTGLGMAPASSGT